MHLLESALAALLVVTGVSLAHSQQPKPDLPVQQGDYIAHNFKFGTGETLPELRLHYRILGQPKRDANDHVTNAVLILHGTGGAGTQFLGPSFSCPAPDRRPAPRSRNPHFSGKLAGLPRRTTERVGASGRQIAKKRVKL